MRRSICTHERNGRHGSASSMKLVAGRRFVELVCGARPPRRSAARPARGGRAAPAPRRTIPWAVNGPTAGQILEIRDRLVGRRAAQAARPSRRPSSAACASARTFRPLALRATPGNTLERRDALGRRERAPLIAVDRDGLAELVAQGRVLIAAAWLTRIRCESRNHAPASNGRGERGRAPAGASPRGGPRRRDRGRRRRRKAGPRRRRATASARPGRGPPPARRRRKVSIATAPVRGPCTHAPPTTSRPVRHDREMEVAGLRPGGVAGGARKPDRKCRASSSENGPRGSMAVAGVTWLPRAVSRGKRARCEPRHAAG